MRGKDIETEERSGRGQAIRAVTIVSAAFVISRLLGFVRGAIILAYYSVDTIDVNAYEIASRVPDAIFYIIAGGALGSAFIPTFAAYFVRRDEAGGWRLFSAVINLVTLVLVVVCILVAIFAEQFLLLFYGQLMMEQPELLPLTAVLMRVMLISTVIFGISGVFMGALNARQHFVLPAVAPILYNAGIILGTILFAPNIMGVAIGTVGGAAAHLLVQIPGLRQKGAQYFPILTIRDAGVQQVIRLMMPRMLGLSFGQINHFIVQILGQAMVFGSIPALSNAWRVILMPQGAIGQALGIVAFPTFAALAAEMALPRMRRILADTMRLIIFLGAPATILLIFLSRPVTIILFQRGNFDPAATDLVTPALAFYAVGLMGLAALEVISRAFYALGDTWTPVWVGGVQLLIMAALGYWLSMALFPALGLLPLGGLALAASLSSTLEAVGLLWLLKRKMGGVDGRYMLDGIWRMGMAALLMAGGMVVLSRVLGQVPALWQVTAGGAAGGGIYLVACLLLGVSEVQQVLAVAQRRLLKR